MKTNLERKSLLYDDACQCKKKCPLPLPPPLPATHQSAARHPGIFQVNRLNGPLRREWETIRKMAVNRLIAPSFFCFTHKLVSIDICQHRNL